MADDGSTLLCCGIPLLAAIVFGMVFMVPSIPLMSIFLVVLIVGDALLLFS